MFKPLVKYLNINYFFTFFNDFKKNISLYQYKYKVILSLKIINKCKQIINI